MQIHLKVWKQERSKEVDCRGLPQSGSGSVPKGHVLNACSPEHLRSAAWCGEVR